jgi:hypothetical protein
VHVSIGGSEWPVEYQATDGRVGPSRQGPCPCGSGSRAVGCHLSPLDDVWITPEAAPLLTGQSTNQSLPKCYANGSNDCSGKITNEHWISNNLLRELTNGAPIQRFGPNWTKKQGSVLSASDFKSRILCERHNNNLSALDTLSGHLLRVIARYQRSLREDQSPRPEFALFDGESVERWLLKTFLGLSVGHATWPQWADDLRVCPHSGWSRPSERGLQGRRLACPAWDARYV